MFLYSASSPQRVLSSGYFATPPRATLPLPSDRIPVSKMSMAMSWDPAARYWLFGEYFSSSIAVSQYLKCSRG